MDMNIGPAEIMDWIVQHKWWLAALLPFVLVVGVLRARG
jgi:hypothetical protein